MVVFAVLTDPSGVTAQVANKDVVVVHKVRIHLKVPSTLEEEHVQRKREIKEQRKGGKRERENRDTLILFFVMFTRLSISCLFLRGHSNTEGQTKAAVKAGQRTQDGTGEAILLAREKERAVSAAAAAAAATEEVAA